MLESIYQRGLSGRRVDNELECYENDELFMFWSHTPRQPWQDARYYEQQRKILRAAHFSRLHENRWVSSESRFIEPTIWDQNVLPGLRSDPSGNLFIGIDASVKHDSTAVVCVKYDQHTDNLVLADHRIWQPSPGTPMDLEATLEFYLRRLQSHGTCIQQVLCDPLQMHRSMTTLQNADIQIEPHAQTQPNLTQAAESLFSALVNRRIRLYDAPALRAHVLNAATVENKPRTQVEQGKAQLKN